MLFLLLKHHEASQRGGIATIVGLSQSSHPRCLLDTCTCRHGSAVQPERTQMRENNVQNVRI